MQVFEYEFPKTERVDFAADLGVHRVDFELLFGFFFQGQAHAFNVLGLGLHHVCNPGGLGRGFSRQEFKIKMVIMDERKMEGGAASLVKEKG